MTRRRGMKSSSLELLLDTICNTFGGIVFISLLVVILLNLTGGQIESETVSNKEQARLAQLSRELEATNRKLRNLEDALDRQSQLAEEMGTSDIGALVAEIARLQGELTNVVVQTNDARVDAAKTQHDVNEFKKLKHRLQDAQTRIDDLKKEYADKVAAKAKEFHPPIQSLSSKDPAGFFLTKGRLHYIGARLADGKLDLNYDDIERVEDAAGNAFLIPKPGGGLAIVSGSPASVAIKKRLAEHDRDAHYIQVWVSPDSFGHLASLHEEITNQRFEYRFVPILKDVRIGLVASTDSNPVPTQR